METKRDMIFHQLELNKKMRQTMTEEEILLFRTLRRDYENKVLNQPGLFSAIVQHIQSQIAEINEKRKHTGPLLHLDAFQPTPICSGWITIKHAGRKSQATMRVVMSKGSVLPI